MSQQEQNIRFYTERVACIHRLTGHDVPPGIDLDDVTLPCEHDPKCPERNKNKNESNTPDGAERL